MKNMPKMLVWKVRRSWSSVMSVMSFVRMLFASVVDEDVELAELVHGLLHRLIAERLVADIPGNGECAAAFLLDDLPGLGGIVMLAEIDDGDVRAFTCEQRGDRPAYAAVAAGDQRHLAIEPPGARIARLPLGLRFQLALVAGLLVLMDHWLHDVRHRRSLL